MSITFNPSFADVVNQFGDAVRAELSYQGHGVLNHIQSCRTPRLGGRALQCDGCASRYIQYHSCRDRHCPICGYQASQAWVEARMQDVLPVTYHHLVFTLPHQLNPWVGRYREPIYRLLFKAVWQTLNQFGQDPQRLNGKLGAMLVLHTWGQTLTRHVHMHCLVPGGALQADGSWRSGSSTWLFPVRALSRHYRGKMVSLLRRSRAEFATFGDTEIDQMLAALMRKKWVVYSKPVLTHTETVIEYLARYTKRIGITNARILRMDERHVWIRYKNYRNDGKQQVMKLAGEELLRRFLMHLLPEGFMRVRYYGYLANPCRRKNIATIVHALKDNRSMTRRTAKPTAASSCGPTTCQRCGQALRFVAEVLPILAAPPESQDTG
jgi:hypothetical protein